MKFSLFVQLAVVAAVVLMAESKPTSEAIVGTPHLFTEYDYPVDPHKAYHLSPAFQKANGPRGQRLVAYFGTGGLRSVERPAYPVPQYHRR